MTAASEPGREPAAPWLPPQGAPRPAEGAAALAGRMAVALGRALAASGGEGARATVSRVFGASVDAALRQWTGRCLALPLRRPGTDAAALIALDTVFALCLCDRLMGGEGREAEMPARRSPTAIESALLEPLLRAIAGAATEALEEPDVLAPGTPCPQPETLDVFSPALPATIMRLTLTIGTRGGAFDLLVLDDHPVLAGGRAAFAASEQGLPWSRTPVKLSARLEPTFLPLRRLAGLSVGDVLQLDVNVSTPVRLFAGEKPIVTGSLGSVGDRLGLRVGSKPSSSRLSLSPPPVKPSP